MFADGVRGRVQLYTTHYRGGFSGIHGFERHSWITVDGRPIINMHRHYYVDGVLPDYGDPRRFQMGLFSWWDLPRSAFDYLNLSIDDVMTSDNTLIRAFGVLDRRLGRRRLAALDPTSEIPLVAELLRFRLAVTGTAAA